MPEQLQQTRFEKSKEQLLLPTEQQAEPLRPEEVQALRAEQTNQEHTARNIAETNASNDNPLERVQAAETAATEAAQPTHVNRELKKITLERELKQIQRKLPANGRILSKVIHQPVVRAVSEVSAKTIMRPSGMLGGGLLAFIGTSAYLFFTRYIGIRYNYLLFVVFFVGGFVVGLALEFLVWSVTARSRARD